MSTRTLLLIILILLILGVLPIYPYSAAFGWYPAGGLIVLLIIIFLILT